MTKELSPHIRPNPNISTSDQVYYQSNDSAEDNISSERSIKEHVQTIIKYRWLIASVSAVVLLLTAAYSFLATPKYTATATLKIGSYRPLIPTAGIENFTLQQTNNADYINTQVKILSSLSLAEKIMLQPEVADKVKQTTGSHSFSLSRAVKSVINKLIPDSENSSPIDSAEPSYQLPAKDLKDYLSMVKIAPVRKTSLVSVSVITRNPALSSQLANLHAKEFIKLTNEERRNSTFENLRFLRAQADELANKVSAIERKIASYAENNSIVTLNSGDNITVKQMGDLNSLLTAATAKRVKSESAFKEASSGSGLSSTAFDDNSIQSIRVRLKETEAEYAQLGRKFKPAYPKMVQLRAQISALKDSLKEQRQQVIRGLEAKYKADLDAENRLKEKLEIQQSSAFDLSRREVKYNILKREYESLKDLHQAVLRQLKEAQLSVENTSSNIVIADKAVVPETHSSPKRALNMLAALFIGPLLGLGLAFFLEAMDNTVKTPEDVERFLGVPSLGVIPVFTPESGSSRNPKLLSSRNNAETANQLIEQDTSAVSNESMPDNTLNTNSELLPIAQNCVTLSAPLSIASEAFKTIRTGILLSSADDRQQVVLITSGQKAEGKTTLATNLSIAVAQSGNKTLLIDADLRRPAIKRHFQIANAEKDKGLVDFLAGQVDYPNIFRDTGVENLDVLLAGCIPPDPSELLGSRKMQELLNALREVYDYIFIDAPPVLPVTDAVLLSRSVDGVVVVVHGQHTQRQVAQTAVGKLKRVGAKILGVVLNDVNINSGDYYYYRSGYYSYYAEDESKPSKLKKRVGI